MSAGEAALRSCIATEGGRMESARWPLDACREDEPPSRRSMALRSKEEPTEPEAAAEGRARSLEKDSAVSAALPAGSTVLARGGRWETDVKWVSMSKSESASRSWAGPTDKVGAAGIARL
jgi:hypothetical protein